MLFNVEVLFGSAECKELAICFVQVSRSYDIESGQTMSCKSTMKEKKVFDFLLGGAKEGVCSKAEAFRSTSCTF